MLRSRLCGLTPRPTEQAPCGSKSTSSTLRPYSASAAPRLMVVVVLPTPPFWLVIETPGAGPCCVNDRGCGKAGNGVPVRPNTDSTVSTDATGSAGLVGLSGSADSIVS